MGKLRLVLGSVVLLFALSPSSVQALGGRRSQLVDALSDPTAQDNLFILNEMARIHLFESFAGVGDMTETGPEDVILEGSRTSTAAARAREDESPLFYGWASRFLKEKGGTSSFLGGWLSSLWGSKLEEEEEGRGEEERELFFASLPQAPALA